MEILLIDDTRDLIADVIARNYESGLFLLKAHKWDLLRLDHDLASMDGSGKEKTGYDIMCFLEENPQHLPHDIELVTANPVGRQKMQVVIDRLRQKGLLREDS